MLLHQKYVESAYEVLDNTDENALTRMIEIVNMEIHNLPPKCKKVFILSKKEGLTNGEIAEYLNISIKTVEALITKAFKLLKEKLEEQYQAILMLIFGMETSRIASNKLK
jgi:RNA polymerase sigma-70 factor (ECF subfamily)